MFPALALLMGKRIAAMSERVLIWQLVPVIPLRWSCSDSR